MERLRADRQVEADRRDNAVANVALLREVAEGLRRLAMDSQSLQDEARRYLTELVELRRMARESAQAARATPTPSTVAAKRNGVRQGMQP